MAEQDPAASGASVLTDHQIAERIRDRVLPSPQRVGKCWLFDLRITGTGAAYRPSYDEFAVRDPATWLTDEMVERCNGLTVTFVHPNRDALDTQEYRERAIGSVVLPYKTATELRGIAKVFDDDAAMLMRGTFRSTSPGVLARPDAQPIELPDGTRVLDEGTPLIFDHLAICQNGVWDKGGMPDGVRLDSALVRLRPMNWHRHDDATFNESDHPRDSDGKFTDGSGGGARHLERTKTVDGKRVQSDGSPLPEHIEKLKIPPAWTDVEYSTDPDAKLLAVGKDSKGRRQAVYSKAFADSQAAKKFARIKALSAEMPAIERENSEARKSENRRIRDKADCCALVMKMGIRPGSDDDTGAKVKAYGATTLEGRHVVHGEDGSVRLQFTGKKGVSIDLLVEDKELAANLVERAKKAGAGGKLFDGVTDKSLLDYTHTLDRGHFKTKDFRTRLGTATAYEIVNRSPPPKTEKEYRKSVMDVARKVSAKLGNTPVIALQSYIAPEVFAAWRIAA